MGASIDVVNQTGVFQYIYEAIYNDLRGDYEYIKPILSACVEFSKNHIICSIALAALAFVILEDFAERIYRGELSGRQIVVVGCSLFTISVTGLVGEYCNRYSC